jgi:hypothetical protein
MSQSTIIALLLALGFLFYIAARGRLGAYMAVFGLTSGQASAAGGTAGIPGVGSVIAGAGGAISQAAGSISSIGNALKSLPNLGFGSGSGDAGGFSGISDFGGGGLSEGVPNVSEG